MNRDHGYRPNRPEQPGRRQRAYDIIFEADLPAGKTFDVTLLLFIVGSVIAVCLETVPSIDQHYHTQLYTAEWIFTGVFTIEYLLRLWCVKSPGRYAVSFFGVVDLLSIIPTYLGLLLPEQDMESLLVIRALRLLRVFRVLKMGRYIREAGLLSRALRASLRKIIVFLFAVLTLVIIIGALMYLIEGHSPGSQFTSVPISMYWAIVTLTTVGYGDITPISPLGKGLAAVVMILGYGIIAVPTGIVSVELVEAAKAERAGGRACGVCSAKGHDHDAQFCKRCGSELPA